MALLAPSAFDLMPMNESASGADDVLRRFRVALGAAEAAPSEASVAALRQAAFPLMNQLRAANVAAGNPYGDDRQGLYRWLKDISARRDRGAVEGANDPEGETG